VEEIQWGGVRVDGIPALDNPRMLPAAKATYLTPDEPVFGIALNVSASPRSPVPHTLRRLPVVLTTWKEWQAQRPETLVADIETGHDRPYVPGSAYGDYFADEGTMFPVWQRSRRLPAKARIYALHLDGIPKAYPVKTLAEKRVVNDRVGRTPVVLIAARGTVTVQRQSRRVGPVTYDAGGEVRAYARGPERFRPGPDASTVLDSTGRPWQVTEDALVGPNGQSAPRLAGHLAYWFGWYASFPKTLLFDRVEPEE
jgi:hypothetical protein